MKAVETAAIAFVMDIPDSDSQTSVEFIWLSFYTTTKIIKHIFPIGVFIGFSEGTKVPCVIKANITQKSYQTKIEHSYIFDYGAPKVCTLID